MEFEQSVIENFIRTSKLSAVWFCLWISGQSAVGNCSGIDVISNWEFYRDLNPISGQSATGNLFGFWAIAIENFIWISSNRQLEILCGFRARGIWEFYLDFRAISNWEFYLDFWAIINWGFWLEDFRAIGNWESHCDWAFTRQSAIGNFCEFEQSALGNSIWISNNPELDILFPFEGNRQLGILSGLSNRQLGNYMDFEYSAIDNCIWNSSEWAFGNLTGFPGNWDLY